MTSTVDSNWCSDPQHPPLNDFRQAFGRPGPRARYAKLEELGLNIDSELERHLGRRVAEAGPDHDNADTR